MNRLKNFEPALLRGVYAAVVALLASLGVGIPADLDAGFQAIFSAVTALLPIVTALVIRPAVTPNAKVVQSTDGSV